MNCARAEKFSIKTVVSGGLEVVAGMLFDLIQIIYLTEAGAVIIKSEIPLNIWKLFVIFLERTIIAIPIIVLLANILL